MQRVFASLYSCDSQYVLSGSDDGAVRIWKAGASDPVGVKSGRELAAKEYRDQLRQKWSSIDTVSKIERFVFALASLLISLWGYHPLTNPTSHSSEKKNIHFLIAINCTISDKGIYPSRSTMPKNYGQKCWKPGPKKRTIVRPTRRAKNGKISPLIRMIMIRKRLELGYPK